MGFRLDPERGHGRGGEPNAARGARSGHCEGKAKAVRGMRTAFLGRGEWRHWGRRGQSREKRGLGGRRKAAQAGLPLQLESSVSTDLLRPLRPSHLSIPPRSPLDAPPPPPSPPPRPAPDAPPPSSHLLADVGLSTPRLLPPPTPPLPSPPCSRRAATSSILFAPLRSFRSRRYCFHFSLPLFTRPDIPRHPAQCPPLDSPPPISLCLVTAGSLLHLLGLGQ